MRNTGSWLIGLGLLLEVMAACGSDAPAQAPSLSNAGNRAIHAGGSSHNAEDSGGESGAGGSAEPGGSPHGGGGEGGDGSSLGAGSPGGAGDNGGGAAGAGGVASIELPPFVCDRNDVALPFATWWAGYCLAKASTRTCSTDFDKCYAATKGFLESGLCTNDDDSNKMTDVACAAAALAYTCPAPISSDLRCGGEPARPEFLDERCRTLDAELQTTIAACAPR